MVGEEQEKVWGFFQIESVASPSSHVINLSVPCVFPPRTVTLHAPVSFGGTWMFSPCSETDGNEQCMSDI